MLSILIMAAGASSRFGGCKSLATLNGIPLLQYVINKAEYIARQFSQDSAQVYVVTGAWHSQIERAMVNGDLTASTVLFNPGWKLGLGHSIAFAVQQIPTETDQVLILLADQIAITAEELTSLMHSAGGADIVCALYSGKRGVPAVFSRTMIPWLAELQGDRGAKVLLDRDDLKITALPMDSANWDIDTEDELLRYQRDASC